MQAFNNALGQGFSVEADLRFKQSKVILAHDQQGIYSYAEDVAGLLRLMHRYPHSYFALHLKEDKEELFKKAARAVQPHANAFLFVTDFGQHNFLNIASQLLGPKQLALYVTGLIVDTELLKMVDYLWLDQTRQKLYGRLSNLLNLNKKMILCSPELFMRRYKRSLLAFKKILRLRQKPFGICTDLSSNYKP